MGFLTWSLPDLMAGRPAVRVNQVAYLPGRPMRATLVDAGPQPVGFHVCEASGARLWSGVSVPWPVRPEPTSGMDVHVLDFSGCGATGTALHLEVDGGARSRPFAIGGTAYGRLGTDATGVLHLLRSGWEVGEEAPPVQRHPPGHAGVPPNRGDTAVPAWTGPDAERLYPGGRCAGTFDVSGGWYDAGDYGKYVTSGAIAAWQLLGTLDLVEDGGAVGTARILDECRWQLEWLARMQVPPGHPLAGMAFHRVHGVEWSPIPGRAHEDPTPRVLHRPSTPATYQLAAVSASAARLYREHDPGFARSLQEVGLRAWAAARANPVLAAPDDHCRFGGGAYGDDDESDDAYWAAAELWLATGDDAFLDALRSSRLHRADVFDLDGFDGTSVAAPARIDLALHGADVRGASLVEADRARASVVEAASRLLEVQAAQPWGQPYAPPSGWDWGSNGRILNNLVVLAVAGVLTGQDAWTDAVTDGVGYLLGRNALGQCYVTGYGSDPSSQLRTRQFGHALDPALPPLPPGAVAGGANSRPHPDFPYDDRLRGLPPQCCYLDEPTSEVTNDLCIRWNAPLVAVSAFLQDGAAR